MYGRILYRFQNTARYWLKKRQFSIFIPPITRILFYKILTQTILAKSSVTVGHEGRSTPRTQPPRS